MDPVDPDPDSDPQHWSEAWIRGYGSTPKCHGSATLVVDEVFVNCYNFNPITCVKKGNFQGTGIL